MRVNGILLLFSLFQSSEQPGTFKCARARCKTCPFICNVEKLSGPKRSIKITSKPVGCLWLLQTTIRVTRTLF